MSVFEEIKEGLKQAIAYNDGKLQARKTEVSTDENGKTKYADYGMEKTDKKKLNKSDMFNEFLKEQLEDASFKLEYAALEPSFAIIEMIQKAKADGMSCEELAEKVGVSTAYIGRLERGTANPSLKTLQRIAAALGKKLQIVFV